MPSPTSPDRSAPPGARGQRLVFLDIVRAYACFMMVFGHTFNELVNASIRASDAFRYWQHLRGLTAPIFLFVSGFAFYIATTRYWDHYLAWTPRLRKRLVRVFWLLVIGYGLHFPFKNPFHIFGATLTPGQWSSFMGVDILQCVAINLLLLHGLILLLGTQRRFIVYLAIAMPAVFLLSPWLWRLNGLAETPRLWNFYLGGNFNSFFPLVPWIGFHYAGILGGFLYRNYLAKVPNWPKWFLLASLALGVAGSGLYVFYLSFPASLKFNTLQAQSLPWRLGMVLFIFSFISLLCQRVKSVPRFITIIGSETLTVYWLHLVIIFGSAWNLGLVIHYRHALNVWQALAVFFPMFAFLAVIVILKVRFLEWWARLRQRGRPGTAGS